MLGSVKLRNRNGSMFDVVVSHFKSFVCMAETAIENGLIVQSWVWDGETRTVAELEALKRHPVSAGHHE